MPYKRPRTVKLVRMIIRRTGNARGVDARIDGAGKLAVFHNPDRLTGKIRKSSPLTGRLHPAVVHPKDKAILAFLDDFLFVQSGVQAIVQGLFQSFQSASFRDVVPFHYPFRFDNRETFPSFPI